MSLEEKASKKDDPRKIELDDLKQLMSTDYGRRFIIRLLKQTSLIESTVNVEDQRIETLHQGGREIGVWLYNEMKQADLDKLMSIIKELV